MAASLLTLVEALAVIGRAALKLRREIKDGPQEMTWLSSRILESQKRLKSQVRLYQHQLLSLDQKSDDLTLSEELAALKVSLDKAGDCLKQIQGNFTTRDRTNNGQCLLWVLREKRPLTRLLEHLQEIERGLSDTLVTFSMSAIQSSTREHPLEADRNRYLSTSSYTSLCRVACQQTLLLDEVRRPKSLGTRYQPEPHIRDIISISQDIPYCSPSGQRQVCWPAKPRTLTVADGHRILESFLMIKNYWDSLRSTCHVRALIRLPCLFSNYAIIVEARILWYQLCWPKISHSVSVRNVVQHNSTFMKACAAGSILNVRRLALDRQGSPQDIDECGVPALHVNTCSSRCPLSL